MATVMFDTHKAIKELQEAGFEEPQAEAVVATIGEVFGANLSTKEDVADIHRKFEDTNRQFEDVHRQFEATNGRIDQVRSEMATKSDLQALEIRLMVRLGGFILAVAGVAMAIARLIF